RQTSPPASHSSNKICRHCSSRKNSVLRLWLSDHLHISPRAKPSNKRSSPSVNISPLAARSSLISATPTPVTWRTSAVNSCTREPGGATMAPYSPTWITRMEAATRGSHSAATKTRGKNHSHRPAERRGKAHSRSRYGPQRGKEYGARRRCPTILSSNGSTRAPRLRRTHSHALYPRPAFAPANTLHPQRLCPPQPATRPRHARRARHCPPSQPRHPPP